MHPFKVCSFLILGGLSFTSHAQVALRSAVFGSGGTAAGGGNIVLVGTVGQPIIGLSSGPVVDGQGFWYTVRRTSATAVEDIRTQPAAGFLLSRNYPNPFSDQTRFDVTVPVRAHIRVTLFDDLGRQVRALIDGDFDPGVIAMHVSAAGLHAGRYLVQLDAGAERRMIALSIVK